MPNKTFDPYDFSKKVIDGVPVYYKNFPVAPCIHINVCFRVGATNDPENIVGVSHFLEHMIFDGSPTIPTKKDINEWSKVYALNSWNAWTSQNNTNYHLKCLPENFDAVLVGMKDMIFNPLLREEDIEHERNVITQEAWGRYKNEKFLAYCKESLQNTFHGTAIAKTYSSLGWPETIAKISRTDVYDWHKTNYVKGNFIIVISGAIENKHLNKIKTFLKDIPEAKVKKVEFGKLRKPLKLEVTKTADEIGDPREQVDITFERMAMIDANTKEEVHQLTSSVLHDILFERMRTEKALCYGVSAVTYVMKEVKGWHTNIKAKEENVETIKTEFWKALNDIYKGKEKGRFEILKKVELDRLRSAEETTSTATNDALYSVNKFGKIVTKKSAISEMKKVEYKDIVACLKEGFKKDWTVTEIILPSKK
jgi:predicted Zn-dependent peptidase